MEYKGLPANLSLKEVTGRSVTGLAAIFGNIDSGNDRIYRSAFKKSIKEGSGRVKHLWQHDGSRPPIAVIKSLREVSAEDLPDAVRSRFPEATGGLEVTRDYLDTPMANEVLEGIKAGAISEMSFAYDALKFDYEETETEQGKIMVRNLRELRLWDTSDVNWGMNAATVAAKRALPFADNGIDAAGLKWIDPAYGSFADLPFEDLRENEIKRIAAHYAYAGSDPVGSFTDLELPHHLPGKAGVGVAVFQGIVKCMAALMDGAIPEKDLDAVYQHLVQHYNQFGEKAPDLKFVQLSRAAKKVQAAGLEIVGLEQLIGSLKGLIAEPLVIPDQALTTDILTRIAIAERELY